MSYNMIDFTLFDRVDCAAESYYHKTFACYHKYKLSNIHVTDSFKIFLELIHEDREANDPRYAEVTVKKQSEINFNRIYGSDPFEKLVKGLDVVLGSYYIVETTNNEIILTSKQKGRVPNMVTPSVEIERTEGVSFTFETILNGLDTDVYVPNNKRSQVHLPITTQGPSYVMPVEGDRLIFIDSVEKERDRTFTRKVVSSEKHAKCTCDILHLDQPIDRLETNHKRINGLGLIKETNNSNNYTARFKKTKVYKRKADYKEILNTRGQITNKCAIPIIDYMNMSQVAVDITKSFVKQSENPHLATMNYFGGNFHWTMFKEQLQGIYDEFGEYLCEHLFLLTSNKSRPEYLVHIDYHHLDPEIPVIGSFTWPVLNCNNDTITVWYDCTLNGQKIYEYGKQDVVITDPNLVLTEIDRYYFDSTTFNSVILKHDDWHTLYNNSDTEENRILLQWRFKPGLSWEKITELTKHLHLAQKAIT